MSFITDAFKDKAMSFLANHMIKNKVQSVVLSLKPSNNGEYDERNFETAFFQGDVLKFVQDNMPQDGTPAKPSDEEINLMKRRIKFLEAKYNELIEIKKQIG